MNRINIYVISIIWPTFNTFGNISVDIETYMSYCTVHVRVDELLLPLRGSGVVQFLFCLQLSSPCPRTRSGLVSLSALLLAALRSSCITRPCDRLMKSGLKSSKASWREAGGEVYSKQSVGRMNTVKLIEVNPLLSKIGFKFILKTFLIYCLTPQKPSHTLVIAQRCRQCGNIMLGFSGDKGKSFSHKGNRIL